MKIENYKFPKSSFLSVEKDMEILTNLILKNDRLQKLLFHTTSTALKERSLTEEEKIGLVGKNIKSIPKLHIDNSVLNYIFIAFDNFTPNNTNPEFRDNYIHFDIICHYDQWHLSDYQLRPYRIAAELDSMLNNQRLTGIGKLEFVKARRILSDNEEYAGISLMYNAIHGEEDKKFDLNPANNNDIINNFDAIFNDK